MCITPVMLLMCCSPLYRTKQSNGCGRQSSSISEKTPVTLSPAITQLAKDKLHEENSLFQQMEHLDSHHNTTTDDQMVESLTSADISAKVLDSKSSAVVSLFSDSELTSNSFLCRYSASMADVNGVGSGPVVVKPSSIAKFISKFNDCLFDH